jgi:energy-coupling factor transport system permease protein
MNRLLENTDPRLKVILLLVHSLSVLISSRLPVLGINSLFLLAVFIFSGKINQVFQPIKTVFPLMFLVLIITPLFTPEGEPLFSAAEIINITDAGLMKAFVFILRLLVLSWVFFLFYKSTDFEELNLTLLWFRLPYNASLVITLSLRYIPHLFGVYSGIKEAHSLRQPVRQKKQPLKDIFPTLVSVLIHAVKSIQPLSMALESRGFGRNNKRSCLLALKALKEIKLQAALCFLYFFLFILLSILTL